jgi:hypothetical protein
MASLAELSESSKKANTAADRTKLRNEFSKVALSADEADDARVTNSDVGTRSTKRTKSEFDELASAVDRMMIVGISDPGGDNHRRPKKYKPRIIW